MTRLTWIALGLALAIAGYAATVTTLAQRDAVDRQPFTLAVTDAAGQKWAIPGVIYLRQGRPVGAKVTGKPQPAAPPEVVPEPVRTTPEVPERPTRPGRRTP